MKNAWSVLLGTVGLIVLVATGPLFFLPATAMPSAETPRKLDPTVADPALEFQMPREDWKMPFKEEIPIIFVTRASGEEWEKLSRFWNETTSKDLDPRTAEPVERKVIKIKVPLGLTQAPTVPVENPITYQKWKLGKDLYFDGILSSDGSVSCATCHSPNKGYTDQSPVSTGIFGKKGGVSAPTVINSAYNFLQFWDGRASSLEDQSQGPPQNPVEMWDGKGHAWNAVVQRIRKNADYVKRFKAVFGTEPTRDGVAKAIASYERTVLVGNSLHDRAEAAKVKAEDVELKPKHYATVLDEAFKNKDVLALKALGLDPEKDANKVAEVARSLKNGRDLFFNKARCTTCHVGENFTDNTFHNLGVGAKDGKLPEDILGRLGAQPLGAKNPAMRGAFKTPSLRALLDTAPYMHDGSEKTLEAVIDFYDRGGNANEWLDINMRDFEAEKAWYKARAEGKPYEGPKAYEYDNGTRVVVPLALKLTPQEKKDLVLFLRALQSDPVDPMVADPKK